MATAYTVTFSSACSPAAPCLFNTLPAPTGGPVNQGIGLGVGSADGTVLANAMAIGGAAATIRVETDGNPNTP